MQGSQLPPRRFGEVVKGGRQNAKLSLRELAERIHALEQGRPQLSPQYLNDIEHGRRNPPDEAVIRHMASVLALDPDVLLALAGKEPKEVREYLQAQPEESAVVGRLFRKARERGFKDWDKLLTEIEKKGREP